MQLKRKPTGLTQLRCWRGERLGRADPPNDVADIISHQERAALIDSYPYRAPHRIAVNIEKPGQYVNWLTHWLAAGERHKDNFVAAARLAIP